MSGWIFSTVFNRKTNIQWLNHLKKKKLSLVNNKPTGRSLPGLSISVSQQQ